jgi:tetratricopeptide (TPR) repeat protein
VRCRLCAASGVRGRDWSCGSAEECCRPHGWLEAYNFLLKGNYANARHTRENKIRALEAYQKAVELDPSYALAWARMGNVAAYKVAQVHAHRGEIDSAFRWLDRAYRQRDPGMIQVRVDPFLQSLRKDARYKALLAKMKLDGDPPALRL